MAKWADYCISKLSFNDKIGSIESVFVHEDHDAIIGNGESKTRDWLASMAKSGKTFCSITRAVDGKWLKYKDIKYQDGGFSEWGDLPKLTTKRKTFLSYYHKDDQEYRKRFNNLFNDLIVSKSVENNDIDSDNSDEYIKQLIQKEYLNDVSVLIVLLGAKTRCRKHVDWEISAALNYKVGDKYSGLIGLLLPSHPDYGKQKYNPSNLPKRLAANIDSGYAKLYDWTDNRPKMQSYIEHAFSTRNNDSRINNIPQMTTNTCD